AVWIDRKASLAPESDLLSWIGPWKLNLFLGQLEEERAIPDAKIIGMRVSFIPVERLEIGLSRIIMFGGEGKSENFSTVWD
ncbi:MAG TPA: capsule assembly Wzi family protein, partial [Marinobacter adhaerens]|nr:capsule assembly Wzi family protein [Marinobacter adhaerens]